jgi:hypothetical protein
VLDLGYVVPPENENRWTDLLAVLILADPGAAAGPLGLGEIGDRPVRVRREVPAGGHDRVDLLVYVDDVLTTVLEAKVLSGLGHAQLERYSASYPGARSYRLIHPERLLIDPGASSGWTGTSWESILRAFAGSTHSWVRETAEAWLVHTARALPEVDARTRWNAVPAGDNFALAMRARMAWVYRRLAPPQQVTSQLVQSGGSKAWVALVRTPAALAGYDIGAEAETRGARSWPVVGSPEPSAAARVGMWVGLRQPDVVTSANFDWEYLLLLWRQMAPTRGDWVTTRPGLPAPHDRDGWRRIGSPASLGFGFGDREARRSGTCMFGARLELPPDTRLGDVADELQQIADLIARLAAVSAAPSAVTGSGG